MATTCDLCFDSAGKRTSRNRPFSPCGHIQQPTVLVLCSHHRQPSASNGNNGHHRVRGSWPVVPGGTLWSLAIIVPQNPVRFTPSGGSPPPLRHQIFNHFRTPTRATVA